MKVAVTGASGFLGRHVLAALARRRDLQVTIASRAVESAADDLPKPWRRVRLDLDDGNVSAFDALGRPDVVLHLAWEGLPNYKSHHHVEHEFPRQYRFLERLTADGLARLVVTGTCFEYGMADGELDEARPADPANPYAIAKDALRRSLQCLQSERRFALVWARLFYLHGTGQAPSSLRSLFVAALARGDASFPMSAGEQLRDFLPADQAASALAALAVDTGADGIVNVCSGRPVSIRRLVEGWREEAVSTIRLELGRYPYPDYEPMAFWGSRRRLDTILPTLNAERDGR
jgi:nucleoside-diphosphate-sugar epimerase